MNLYGYVGGDPLNLSDPSGMQDSRSGCGSRLPSNGSSGASTCHVYGMGGRTRSAAPSLARQAQPAPRPSRPATPPPPANDNAPNLKPPPVPINLVTVLTAVFWLAGTTELADADRDAASGQVWVIRGGLASAESLIAGTGPAPLGLTGFSVTTAPVMSPHDLAMARAYPNTAVSATSVEALNQLGYQVVATPLPGQPFHGTVVTPHPLSPAAALELAGAFVIKFPNPNVGR
jgi:hypothetical protein